MNTALIHLRNTEEGPKIIYRTKRDALGKLRKYSIGVKPKDYYIAKPKVSYGISKVPMYTKVYTHVYTGRDKAFYENPEWRAKADAIRASRKKTLANFGKRTYNGHT
jgi:hypothetical protein